MLEYMGWKEAADLINAAYVEVVSKQIVTYDFARQMEAATEVSTSGFATALIQQIMDGKVDAASFRKQREEIEKKERKAAEERRVSGEGELESGRTPHTAGDIMTTKLVSVTGDTTVEQAMRVMSEKVISGILIEPDVEGGEWAIMTQKDVMTKIIHANHSPNIKASEIATKPLTMVDVGTSLHECVNLMSKNNIRRVFVVGKNNKPIGIVTYTDIIRTVNKFGWVPVDL